MAKEGSHQLELFSGNIEQNAKVQETARRSFLNRIWVHERTILFIISLLIASLVAFSLGIEKGKRMAIVELAHKLQDQDINTRTSADTGIKPVGVSIKDAGLIKNGALWEIAQQDKILTVNQKNTAVMQKEPLLSKKYPTYPAQMKPVNYPGITQEKKKPANNVYTVQLATFSNKSSAQREAGLLKKKGYETLILEKGKYTLLCVGRFSDKEKADKSLREIKKQTPYKDCRIRRI